MRAYVCVCVCMLVSKHVATFKNGHCEVSVSVVYSLSLHMFACTYIRVATMYQYIAIS